MQHFKQNITNIPTYLDGTFKLFAIIQDDSTFPQERIQEIPNKEMNYKDLSISDKLKYDLSQRSSNVYKKIRIPQTREITSLNVLELENKFYQVYNAYHFTNNEGYPETDLTLEEYPNPKIIKETENEQKGIN